MNRLPFLILVSMFAAGCGDERTRLQKSCDGERVPFCEPYAYAVVEEATLEPMEIDVGDPADRAMLHVRMATCGEDAPGAHEVRIGAIVDVARPDAGGATIYSLATVRDDGTDGDATARDGLIDITIANPFGRDFPSEADILLEFEPFLSPMCLGQALDGVPYRTGRRFVPDAGP